jgi:hypothetical protein
VVANPLGLGLAIAGLRRRQPFTLVLGAGVSLVLLLALLHEDTGVHTVGPIHYSECAVALILLATAGIVRLVEWGASLSLAPSRGAALVVANTLGLGLYLAPHALSLRQQATNQVAPFAGGPTAGLHDAVVFAPPPGALYQLRPEMRASRSWVLQLPHPDPLLRDSVIYVHHDADPAAIQRAFPSRSLFFLRYGRPGEPAVRVFRFE